MSFPYVCTQYIAHNSVEINSIVELLSSSLTQFELLKITKFYFVYNVIFAYKKFKTYDLHRLHRGCQIN